MASAIFSLDNFVDDGDGDDLLNNEEMTPTGFLDDVG
jgi:hypothetical protein